MEEKKKRIRRNKRDDERIDTTQFTIRIPTSSMKYLTELCEEFGFATTNAAFNFVLNEAITNMKRRKERLHANITGTENHS